MTIRRFGLIDYLLGEDEPNKGAWITAGGLVIGAVTLEVVFVLWYLGAFRVL